MLTVTGKVLDVESETVNGASGSFVSTTVSVLVGKAAIERLRLGREFGEHPKEGETLTAEVVVSAFATRNGAGYRLTALRRVGAAGARIAAAS